MAEKNYDINDVLKQAGNVDVTSKNKKSATRKVIVSIACVIVAAIIVVPLLVAFLTKTDFSKDVPLTENISRWTPLNWTTADGDLKEDMTIKSENGDWKFVESLGSLSNETLGCTLTFTSVTGDTGEKGGDLENTDGYKQSISREVGGLDNIETVWVDVFEQDSRVQMNKATYVSDGKYGSVVYRHSPENARIMLGIYSCETEEALKKVNIGGDGSEFSSLGITVKPSFFSAF